MSWPLTPPMSTLLPLPRASKWEIYLGTGRDTGEGVSHGASWEG